MLMFMPRSTYGSHLLSRDAIGTCWVSPVMPGIKLCRFRDALESFMKRRGWVIVGSLLVLGATGLVLANHASEHEALPPVARAAWTSGCGGCHLAYHPALLPARSWRALVEESSSHFGHDLALEDDARMEITAFLVANAADNSPHRGARKLARLIASEDTPRRITEAKWFAAHHDEVGPSVWKRQAIGGPGNCAACHARAANGDFDGHHVSIPH